LANESRATTSKAHAKHGKYETPEYYIWEGIVQRCTNPKTIGWKHYGGRGITVCERWRDFKNFYADMGERPKNRSIDRIDNNGPYSPENCRWASTTEQIRNRRNSTLFTIDGVTAHIDEWGAKFGITANAIRARLRIGWDTKSAVMTPLRKGRYAKHHANTSADRIQ
jgi:hypothetical protein